MFNIKKTRKYFSVLNQQVNGFPLIYFDSSATCLKPDIVVKKINDYYLTYPSNVHRSDFAFGYKATKEYESSRELIADYFKCDIEEVIFTSGSTESSNIIAHSFVDILKKGDEIVLNEAEHASNLLPWYYVAKKTKAKIVFAQLEKDFSLNFHEIKKVITSKTKIIVFALTTNVIGDTRDIEKIVKFAKKNNILTVVDAAQGIIYNQVNLEKTFIDFMFFSGHKVFGPTGVGVLIAKKHVLKFLKPYSLGGGMNYKIDNKLNFTLKPSPYRFEAGTPNIAGVIGLKAAFNFLKKFDQKEVKKYLLDLKKYTVDKLSQNPKIKIYNPFVKSNIIIFKYQDVFSQDVVSFLSTKGIAVRGGDHCCKLLKIDTIRISLSLYNTKEEIDFLISCLKHKTLNSFLDIYFEEEKNGL